MTTLKEEEPYAAVVNNEAISRTCSKCFAWRRVQLSRCAGCQVLYYCNPECQKADWKDHKAECKLFRSANFVPSEEARLVMRMMEKSRKHPDIKSFNGRTYNSLAHNSAKHRENIYYMTAARTIYDEISRFMGSKAPDFETAFLAINKEEMNEFTIHDGSWACIPRGSGIYLGLSVLEHSCRPDAFVVNQGPKMMLRTAKKDVVYSDKLTISYYNEFPFLDTDTRRSKLYDDFSFMCKCDECLDIESHKKKTSGRPSCCPDSWFSISDLVCNNCSKKVFPALAHKAKTAMKRLRGAIESFAKQQSEGSALSDGLIDVWIKLFNSSKEVLSNENSHLFAIVHMINLHVPLSRMNVVGKFADVCASYVRKNSHCVFSAILLSRRQNWSEMQKEKTLQELKQAYNEAIDSVKVVFGLEHELTQMLLQKKSIYDSIITTNY